MSQLAVSEHERTFLIGHYTCDGVTTLLCYSYCVIIHENMFDKNKMVQKLLHVGTGLSYNDDTTILPEVKVNYTESENVYETIEEIPTSLYISRHEYVLNDDIEIQVQYFVRGKSDNMLEKIQELLSSIFSLISLDKEVLITGVLDTLLEKDSGLKELKNAVEDLLYVVTDKVQLNILITNLMVACMYLTGNYYDIDLRYMKPKKAILRCFEIMRSLV